MSDDRVSFNLKDRIRFKSDPSISNEGGIHYDGQEADVICLPQGGVSSTSTTYTIKFDDGQELVAWQQELTFVRAARAEYRVQ